MHGSAHLHKKHAISLPLFTRLNIGGARWVVWEGQDELVWEGQDEVLWGVPIGLFGWYMCTSSTQVGSIGEVLFSLTFSPQSSLLQGVLLKVANLQRKDVLGAVGNTIHTTHTTHTHNTHTHTSHTDTHTQHT